MTSDNCLLAGPRGKAPVRRSTRDLIGSLRQQAGLPSVTHPLPPPQLQPQEQPQAQAPAQQRTITVQAAGSTTQPAVTATPPLQQQELGTTMPQVPTLIQQPLSASPAYDLSVESSEAHTFTDQPQIAAGSSAASVGQPVLPQSGLLELVSNPLYARSLDISRTTSTSPTRVEANAVAKQAEPAPESVLSEIPTSSAVVQVSDQPILSGPAEVTESQASGSAVDLAAEGAAAGQLVQQSATGIEDTGTAVAAVDPTSHESELTDNPAVLQVSDQPIFTPGPAPSPEAAPAETLPGAESEVQAAAGIPPAGVVAAPQLMSAQPLLASPIAVTVPAEHQATTALLEHATDPGMTTEVVGSGANITLSNQPILGTAAIEASPAVTAETVHMTSSQPLLGPVITQPHDSAAVLSTTQTAPLSSSPVPSQELQTSQQPAQSLTQVSTESAPVMSSQPQLGPVRTQPSNPAATPLPMQQAPLSLPSEESHISQQPAQPVKQLTAEPTPVMSSQPLLGPELSIAHAQAPPIVYQQVQAPQQQPQPLQGTSHAESITSLRPVSGASTPTQQVSMESQGSVLRPPVPALPSVRRSRSDVRGSLQAQPSSVRRSMSILPATPESAAQGPPSTPLGAFPMPQLRRSVTSLPTSPVPHFPRTATAAQPQLQQVVLHQAPLSMPPPAYLQHSSLGPLQEGIAAVPHAPAPQQHAHTRTLGQPASQPPATAILPAAPMVAPQAPTPLVDPQEVHLTVTSSPQMHSEPSTSTVNVEQQDQLPLLQESSNVQLIAQQPEAAMVSQGGAVQMQGVSPSSQVFEASPPLQHNAPVFMRSFDVGAPQHAPPRPAHSPQIMRTNTWSPHPNILQPALPGQAGPAQDVQGPLSMGFQQSWNNPVPALPEVQAAPSASPPGVERDYAYSRAYPTAVSVPPNSPQAYAYGQTYGQSSPVQQADFAYGGSMPMGSAAAGYAAANSRAYQTVGSVPMAAGSREVYSAVAPASMAMYQQPGPLSGGLAQQMGPPSRQPPRQHLSMSSRTVPAGLASGTVIQPMQGPVVVGEQSAAVTTEPMLTHSQGFSIQPLSQAQGTMQGSRGLNTAVMQRGSPSQQQQQQQPEASRQGGGGIAKRILQDFGRSSRSSFNAGASVNTSFQSDRSLQQVVI